MVATYFNVSRSLPIIGPLLSLPVGVVAVSAIVSLAAILILSDTARKTAHTILGPCINSLPIQALWYMAQHSWEPLLCGVGLSCALVIPVNFLFFCMGIPDLTAFPSLNALALSTGVISVFRGVQNFVNAQPSN